MPREEPSRGASVGAEEIIFDTIAEITPLGHQTSLAQAQRCGPCAGTCAHRGRVSTWTSGWERGQIGELLSPERTWSQHFVPMSTSMFSFRLTRTRVSSRDPRPLQSTALCCPERPCRLVSTQIAKKLFKHTFLRVFSRNSFLSSTDLKLFQAFSARSKDRHEKPGNHEIQKVRFFRRSDAHPREAQLSSARYSAAKNAPDGSWVLFHSACCRARAEKTN